MILDEFPVDIESISEEGLGHSAASHILDPLIKKIMSFRSRELRNFLIQKAGFKKKDIDKILDREELRSLAIEYKDKLIEIPSTTSGVGGSSGDVSREPPPDLWYDFVQLLMTIMSQAGLLVSIIMSFAFLIYILTLIKVDSYISLYSYFDDKAEHRLVSLKNAMKQRWWLPTIFFSVTSALSLYVAILRWRVLFSWTPAFVFNNFPVVTKAYRVFNMLPCMSVTLPKDTKLIGNLNLDLGPLIFQFIINKVRERLDLYGMKRSWEKYKQSHDENPANSKSAENNNNSSFNGNGSFDEPSVDKFHTD
jgi:hypothetical protein